MSSKPSINLVFQTDDGHAWMTSIAVRSLIATFEQSSNSNAYRLNFIFVSHGLNAKSAEMLFRSSSSASVDVQNEIVDCPLQAASPEEKRIELFTLRLRFPEILPHFDRILFLDSDILVVDDISKLWEIDLRNQWLGAVTCLNTADEICLRNYNKEFKIQFKQSIDPINGGVVILDLRKMRELNITKALTDWLQANRTDIYNPDQEAISMHCGGQFTVLPPEWISACLQSRTGHRLGGDTVTTSS
jgi:lipopolysaccharide biosynthesis glycosyltransferase